MNLLKGKKILFGVTGGIAAYKSCELVRMLVKQGAEVNVIMTENATKFVQPLTFETLSKHRVWTDTFKRYEEGEINHIQAGREADAVVIAPATANVIAKIVHGIADDLLTSTLLSTRKHVVVAPAMDWAMFKNEVTQENLAKLEKMERYTIIPPEEGELASGESGRGRLATLEHILDEVIYAASTSNDLEGENVLITAGPTFEDLDPVRYIGNRSSGKMGFALAREARARGARVVLVAGPNRLVAPHGVEVVDVRSNAEMLDAVMKYAPDMHIIIKAAAVADYRPARYYMQKIEKGPGPLALNLERTADILFELGRKKTASQFLVGFAAETQQVLQKATNKLKQKNLDLIVVNDLSQDGAGFDEDTNIVHIIDRKGHTDSLPIMDKADVAHEIFCVIQKERANGKKRSGSRSASSAASASGNSRSGSKRRGSRGSRKKTPTAAAAPQTAAVAPSAAPAVTPAAVNPPSGEGNSGEQQN